MRLALAALFAIALPIFAQDQIAKTDAKSPADEQKSFKVPPGFEVQLVAADPDIGKPIQIAFDAKGRLWATTSRHYPFPAPAGEKPSDKLYVLGDIGPDGKAKKVTVFATDLNIPIGILPLPDCKSCLVSECGSILKLTDTDGDGKADQRETILAGFGFKDTHGMYNSFVLLPDGWVYACHGYANASTVKAKDGSTVTMQSGNTFRFRPDGSRVEPWTFGQVNPFGMTVDPYFNLYTADCHSKPITQLIRGAHYDSFGKPHDGLGYAPHVTKHDHGSTALCGLAWYDADHFPKEWNGCMFLGNVITNRVNADRIEWKGATPVAKELPDFLTSSDPWFRPTDIKLGPDGALYVADFYNRIIGHYEVDLKHPLRDKDRGRVWRVVWKGMDGNGKAPAVPYSDITTVKTAAFGDLLEHANSTVRLQATNELIRRGAKDCLVVVDTAVSNPLTGPATLAWLAKEAGVFDRNTFVDLLGRNVAGDSETIRAAASMPQWRRGYHEVIISLVNTYNKTPPEGRTRGIDQLSRAAVEALGTHPHPDNVAPLVNLIRDCLAEDTHLKFAARVALRNALRDADGWEAAGKLSATPADVPILVDAALSASNGKAAAFLAVRFSNKQVEAGRRAQVAEFVGRNGEKKDWEQVVNPTLGQQPDRLLAGIQVAQALLRGMQAAGGKITSNLEDDTLSLFRLAFAGTDLTAQAASVSLLKQITQMAPPDTPYLTGFAKQHGNTIATWAANPARPAEARLDAVEALLRLDPPSARPVLRALVVDPAVPNPARERAVGLLSVSPTAADEIAIKDALKAAPYRLSVSLANSLASTKFGADLLFAEIQGGRAPARLLQEKPIIAKLRATRVQNLDARIAELTKGLPSPDARLDALLRTRTAGYPRAQRDLAKGKEVFTKSCAICHQLGGQGAKVGPNLDGIGNRGLERLLEDVLDPNRNIDVPFRATIINTLDGQTLTGQFLREEGQVTVLADANGKEVRIEAKDIDKKSVSTISVMPANVDTTMPEADFYHLLAYLLEQRVKEK